MFHALPAVNMLEQSGQCEVLSSEWIKLSAGEAALPTDTSFMSTLRLPVTQNHLWYLFHLSSCSQAHTSLSLQVKKKFKKYRPPVARTHLWTRDGGANTPCFGGQLKYRTPPTEPSFLPLGLSSLMPNQKPGWTQGQSRNGLKHSHNYTSLTNSKQQESSTFIKCAAATSKFPADCVIRNNNPQFTVPIALLLFVSTLSCTRRCSLPALSCFQHMVLCCFHTQTIMRCVLSNVMSFPAPNSSLWGEWKALLVCGTQHSTEMADIFASSTA